MDIIAAFSPAEIVAAANLPHPRKSHRRLDEDAIAEALDLSEAEIRAYVIADNRLAELAGNEDLSRYIL